MSRFVLLERVSPDRDAIGAKVYARVYSRPGMADGCARESKRRGRIMERREFLGSVALGASLLATASADKAHAADGGTEYYLLRRYQFSSAQARNSADYFSNALIPALNRMKIAPVGVFNATIGLTSPNPYLLLPCGSLDTLAKLDEKLAADADYQKAAKPFVTGT